MEGMNNREIDGKPGETGSKSIGQHHKEKPIFRQYLAFSFPRVS